jgi:hypothetical protein
MYTKHCTMYIVHTPPRQKEIIQSLSCLGSAVSWLKLNPNSVYGKLQYCTEAEFLDMGQKSLEFSSLLFTVTSSN